MKLSKLNRDEIENYRHLTAVLPLGAIEQHGSHLPVGTDGIICNAVCETAENRYPDKFLLLEPMPYGLNTGLMDLDPEILYKFITDIGNSLSKQGINRFIIASVHGGNKYSGNNKDPDMQEFIDKYNSENKMMLSYFDALSMTPSDGGYHANETETSFMLYVAPELVDMSKACKEYPIKGKESKSGVWGDATIATAENGKLYLEEMVSSLICAIDSEPL